MRIQGPFKLKRKPLDQSDAIVLTFHHRWHDLLLGEKIAVVFRKTGPAGFIPNLMYAYVAAPTSAIVCRMPIVSYNTLSLSDAPQFADRGAIETTELRRYAATTNKLLVMEVGQISVAQRPLTCEFLGTQYNFWPSSTFIPLSHTGVVTLDMLCRFEPKTSSTKYVD